MIEFNYRWPSWRLVHSSSTCITFWLKLKIWICKEALWLELLPVALVIYLFISEALPCSSTLTDQNFEVKSGSAWMKRSHPSVFVKLIYCWLHNWKAQGCLAGCTSTLQSVVFFGHMVNLQLHIFLFPVWITHLHGKNLSCVLGFPLCGQHKGRWDGMWEKGVCSTLKCMFWCLFDSLGQWLMSVHTQS